MDTLVDIERHPRRLHWPIKYRAPYDAITKLRILLASQHGVRSPQ